MAIPKNALETVQSPRQIKAFSVALPISSMNFGLDVYILILPITGSASFNSPVGGKLVSGPGFSPGFRMLSALYAPLILFID